MNDNIKRWKNILANQAPETMAMLKKKKIKTGLNFFSVSLCIIGTLCLTAFLYAIYPQIAAYLYFLPIMLVFLVNFHINYTEKGNMDDLLGEKLNINYNWNENEDANPDCINYKRNYQYLNQIIGENVVRETFQDLKEMLLLTQGDFRLNAKFFQNSELEKMLYGFMEDLNEGLNQMSAFDSANTVIEKQIKEETIEKFNILRAWSAYNLLNYTEAKNIMLDAKAEEVKTQCVDLQNHKDVAPAEVSKTLQTLSNCVDMIDKYSQSKNNKKMVAALKIYQRKVKNTDKAILSNEFLKTLTSYSKWIQKNYEAYDSIDFIKQSESKLEFSEKIVLNILLPVVQ